MFTKILLVLVALVAIFAGVVAMQPADFHVERSATMAASPEAVFAQINDFHAWEKWSPWAKKDEKAKTSYEGPAAGVGAIFKWSGNSDVGEGMMTLKESKPNEQIKINLEFIQPFAGSSDVLFTFKPDGDKTIVTWSMSGKNNFLAKAINLFMDCEKMCGDEFDQGLASIKEIVEKK